MARLKRSTFALMLALLPATATVIGFVVLGQVPTLYDLAGITLVIVGVATHQEPNRPARAQPATPLAAQPDKSQQPCATND